MIKTRLISPIDNAYDPPLLIKSILAESLKNEPDNEIHYRDQMKMTYRELNKRVRQLANVLTNMGVKPGDVIGVLEFDSNRYLELYFAVPMIGAVLHTINYRLSPEQLAYTMNHAEDKIVFCHQTLSPMISGVLSKLDTVEKYVILTEKGQEASVDFDIVGEYEELLAVESEAYEFPDFDENTMATLFYTTGTTGLPKGVCFSHRQLVLHSISAITSLTGTDSPLRLDISDVYMPITPMFHVHAWGMPYVATMLGLKQVYPGPYEPEMLLKLILTHRVTFCHCVPTILGMLVMSPAIKDLDLSFFRVIIGGSALPEGLARAALDNDIEVITGYGMSETCPVLTLTYLPEGKRKELSKEENLQTRLKTGKPVLFVDLKIMDEEGSFLPHDGKTIGEIVVRAPWLTQRYFKEDGRSKELWKGGYMHTGDMAVVESDGTVTIVDRKKDVIKSGGEWISSIELESLISSHPAVTQAAIVGVKDEKWGERPYALVVKGEGQDIDADDVQEHLRQFVQSGHISKWAVPEQYEFVKEIPKTSVGKIDKKLIRKKLGE